MQALWSVWIEYFVRKENSKLKNSNHNESKKKEEKLKTFTFKNYNLKLENIKEKNYYINHLLRLPCSHLYSLKGNL